MVIEAILSTDLKYADLLDLRGRVLKRPDFVGINDEVMERDKFSTHLLSSNAFEYNGCVSFLIEGDKCILRQMAVIGECRGSGLGRELVSNLENYAYVSGVYRIECEARSTAMGFYLKQGYKIIGPEYFISGISHTRMAKQLVNYAISAPTYHYHPAPSI